MGYIYIFLFFLKRASSFYGTQGHIPGLESGQPWVWGVTRPTKGEAGSEWMTDSGTDPQNSRLRVVVNRPAEKPMPAFEPATSASLSQKHTTEPPMMIPCSMGYFRVRIPELLI